MKESTNSNIAKIGTFLLAQPFMHDAYFNRSVVYMTEDRQGGAVGFVVNKPMKAKIYQLVDDFPKFEARVCYGGPVANDTLHFLHTAPDLIEDTTLIGDGVYWGGDFEQLKRLARSRELQAEQILFFVGYSGWSAGQLQTELQRGSWIEAQARQEHLFKFKPTTLWEELMREKGENYAIIAQLPDTAIHN